MGNPMNPTLPFRFANLYLLVLIMVSLSFGSPAKCRSMPKQDTVEIKNGSFSKWQDDRPVEWKVEIGATNGADAPRSIVKKGPGSSLELSGKANTMAWHSVSQTFDVTPGQSIELSYEAKAVGIKREARQFDNCYVALFPIASDGTKIPPLVWPVDSKKYQKHNRPLIVPANVSKYNLIIFLSKTGKLNIRKVQVGSTAIKPGDSFDLLVDDMAKHYSFFELKKIDWKKLTNKYRADATAADTPAQFAQVVSKMLDELKDTHVSVFFGGKRYGRYSSRTTGKVDFQHVKNDLSLNDGHKGKLGVVASTKDGFGYINVMTLANVSQQELNKTKREITKRFDAPGFIIDLRENGGGSEMIAQDIAGLFANDEFIYARSVRRNGDRTSDFSAPTDRVIRPSGIHKPFDGPVVCLIGPNTVSSAEGFALMMKAIPNCTVVGQPTRGASGNPAATDLPNGVQVWFSRWKSLTPDGDCIEEVGVQPDVKIQTKRSTDPAYEEAKKILNKTLSEKSETNR